MVWQNLLLGNSRKIAKRNFICQKTLPPVGAWFIEVGQILEIFTETGGQNSKQFARNDHWMTLIKKIAKRI